MVPLKPSKFKCVNQFFVNIWQLRWCAFIYHVISLYSSMSLITLSNFANHIQIWWAFIVYDIYRTIIESWAGVPLVLHWRRTISPIRNYPSPFTVTHEWYEFVHFIVLFSPILVMLLRNASSQLVVVIQSISYMLDVN